MNRSIAVQLKSTLANSLRLALLVTTILSLAATSTALAGGRHARGPHVYPPGSHPFGKSYAEWQASFWQWALALPVEGHPFIDSPDYEFSAGQSGKVWYIGAPDGPLTRTAIIPEGTALFVTVRDVETSTLEEPPFYGATEAEQRANSAWFADHIVDLFCIIDGVPVKNLENYRVASPQFEFNAPTPWVWGAVGGTGTSVGDGYFVMVDRLSVGHHTIHYGGTYHFEPGEFGDEALDLPHDVTIEITVVKDRHHGHHGHHGHGDEDCDGSR